MASVYILFSDNLNRFYIRSCKVLSERLEKNLNKTFIDSFTSNADDWGSYFSINDLSYKQAIHIETHIKKMKSKVYVENLKKHSDLIENLKRKYPKMI